MRNGDNESSCKESYDPRRSYSFGGSDPRSEFKELFANRSDTATETHATILQALAMMNGSLVAGATDLQESSTLAAVAAYPRMDTAGRIETLYLATLSRPPREDESKRLVAYVDSGGPAEDPNKALSDVFWALLNSSEFMFNH